jgi:hypothetical protein
MKRNVRRVRDPQRGNSWGLEYPYLYAREGDEWLVYKAPFRDGRRRGGEVVASYSIERHGAYRAEDLASKRSQKLNGLVPDRVDVAGIDSTP